VAESDGKMESAAQKMEGVEDAGSRGVAVAESDGKMESVSPRTPVRWSLASSQGPSRIWVESMLADDKEDEAEQYPSEEEEGMPPSAELYAAFGATLDQTARDLSLFSVLALSLPTRSAPKTSLSVKRAKRPGRVVACVVMCAMLVLVVFLQLVLPSFIITNIQSKFRCTSHASWVNRLSAASMFALLYMSMYGSLLEARIFCYLAALFRGRQRAAFFVAAMGKVACCGAVLIATYALFVVHPLPTDFLLNGLALSFLLTVDSLVMAASKNAPVILPFYQAAKRTLEDAIAKARTRDPALLDDFATFHSLTFADKLKNIRGGIDTGRPYLAIYLAAVYLLSFASCWAIGLLLWCLPEQNEVPGF